MQYSTVAFWAYRNASLVCRHYRGRTTVSGLSCYSRPHHSTTVGFASAPAGSPSRGGDVMIHVKEVNQPSLPTPFYSVLVSVAFCVALSTVVYSINSPLSHSVLPVLSLPYWSFQLYISV